METAVSQNPTEFVEQCQNRLQTAPAAATEKSHN